MPCLELSLPPVPRETRVALAAGLTEAFCAATGHPPELFSVRFFEVDAGMASVGGRLCDEEGASPYLHLLLYCPRLKRSVKQRVGAALTEAFTRAVRRSDWTPVIHVCEHPYDNVVVEGRLLTDSYEDLAKRAFYYELPRD